MSTTVCRSIICKAAATNLSQIFDRTADKKNVWRRKSQFNICTTLEDHLSAQKERRICLVVSEEAALTTNTIFHTTTAITTKAATTTTTAETKI